MIDPRDQLSWHFVPDPEPDNISNLYMKYVRIVFDLYVM